MTEKIEIQSTDINNQALQAEESRRFHFNTLKENAKKLVGPIALAAALANVAPAMAENAPAAQAAGESVEMAEPNLRPLESLPGAEYKVSLQSKDLLKNATVKIMRREKTADASGQPGMWKNHCTGVKIKQGKNTFISTAAHCFRREQGTEYSVKNDRGETERTVVSQDMSYSNEYEGAPVAADFIRNSEFEYALFDPKVIFDERQPIATVTGISLNLTQKDAALLRVMASPNVSAPNRSYKKISSIVKDKDLKQPKPGQKVIVTGAPTATANMLVTRRATYLGQAKRYYQEGATDNGEMVDLVAYDSPDPSTDPCNFGGSGTSFVADTETPKTLRKNGKKYKLPTTPFMSGALSIRSNISYDPVDSQPSITDPGARQAIAEKMSKEWHYYRDTLGVQLNERMTICGFAVEPVQTITEMKNAFGKYAQRIQSS
jgi:hypothetical protein